MNSIHEDPRPVQDGGCFDVVVVGGGIAGVSASVAASRTGASVLLLEKNVLLGGLATVGLISWYEPLCDGEGTKMTSGIAEELIRLAVDYGPNNLSPKWLTGAKCGRTDPRYACSFSPTIFSLALNEYLEENNVQVLLDVLATYPVMDGNICRGVMVQAKEGRIFFGAKTVIDATGDAAILHAGNVPTVNGKNFMTYVAHSADRDVLKKAVAEDNIHVFRRWQWLGATAKGDGQPENVPLFTGVTSAEITEYVRLGQRMLFEQVKKMPVGSYDLLALPCVPQLRTTRRLDGAYTFTGGQERLFEDAIGACGDFRARGERWQVPYRTLYNPAFPNLLAAGRIISAEGDGWEVTRVIPGCALTGQAAGTAAAIAIAEGCGVPQVEINVLQKKLSEDNVILNWEQ